MRLKYREKGEKTYTTALTNFIKIYDRQGTIVLEFTPAPTRGIITIESPDFKISPEVECTHRRNINGGCDICGDPCF